MFERTKYKEGYDWTTLDSPVASKKYDGAHFFMRVEPDGALRFFSRRESVKGGFPERTEKLPHLTDKKMPGYAGHVYSVELIHTGNNKNNKESHADSSGILNSLAPKAISTQAIRGPIRAVLLDVKHPEHTTFEDKLTTMRSFEKDFGKPDVLFTPDIKIGKDNIEELIRSTKERGDEGVIITSLKKPESENFRVKVKHYVTYNLKVKKILQEFSKTGVPKQSAGALVLEDATGREVGQTGTGFDRNTRIDIFNNPKNWLGKLIQVKAQPTTKKDAESGRLRVPVYNGEADGEIDTVTV